MSSAKILLCTLNVGISLLFLIIFQINRKMNTCNLQVIGGHRQSSTIFCKNINESFAILVKLVANVSQGHHIWIFMREYILDYDHSCVHFVIVPLRRKAIWNLIYGPIISDNRHTYNYMQMNWTKSCSMLYCGILRIAMLFLKKKYICIYIIYVSYCINAKYSYLDRQAWAKKCGHSTDVCKMYYLWSE